MIKIDLIKNIVNKFDVREIEAAEFVDNIFESISLSFKKGKNINIPEFGKFKVVNKTVDGIRQKYVTFSPVKNFADLVNEDFSDLEPQITKVYSLKNNATLKVREILPDGNDEDYLYFVFEDSVEIEGIDELSNELETSPEQILLKEEEYKTKGQTVFQDDYINEIADLDVDTRQNVFVESNYNVSDEILKINDELIVSNDFIDTDTQTDSDIPFEKDEDAQDVFVPENQIDDDTFISDNKQQDIPQIKSPLVFSRKGIFEDDFGEEDVEKDILNLLVRREEILSEMKLYDSIPISAEETVSTPVTVDVVIPQDISEQIEKPEHKELIESKSEDVIESLDIPEPVAIPKEDDILFSELEKRIKELDELAKTQDEILAGGVQIPQNAELQVFDKLIDDKPVIEELEPLEPLIRETPEVIVEELMVEKVEANSLTEALENIQSDDIIEHLAEEDKPDDVKSFDDVFKKKDKQFVPQFTVDEEKPNTQGRFFKVFLYVFFVFLVGAFAFYVYKSMFTKSNGNQVVDTVGLTKIDSVRQLLAKSKADSVSKLDPSLRNNEDDNKGESVEVKNLNGVVYRELNNNIYIQNKVVDDINEANEIEVKLKLNNLSCRVEAIMTLENKLEYRVLVGPFDTMELALEYYELNKAVLNFIQILNPRKTNLLVL